MLVLNSCSIDSGIKDNLVPSLVQKSESTIVFENRIIDFLNAKISSNEYSIGEEMIQIEDFQTEIQATELDFIINKINKESNLALTSKVGLITFYFNHDFSKKLNFSDIKSFSIFYPDENGINRHELYLRKNDNSFILSDKYSQNSGIVLLNDLRYIAPTIFPEAQKISIVTLKSSKYKVSDRNYEPTRFSETVIDNAEFLLSNFDDCATNCFGSGPECEVAPVGGSGTCHGICPLEETVSQVQQKNVRVSASLSKDKGYKIRDEILSKSKRGKKYIEYYYKIAQVSSRFKTVNSKTLISHIEVANELIRAADILENGAESDKVITKNAAEKISSLVRNYRSIAKNAEFQNILNEIDSDLHYVTEKSKKDVLLFMQHD